MSEYRRSTAASSEAEPRGAAARRPGLIHAQLPRLGVASQVLACTRSLQVQLAAAPPSAEQTLARRQQLRAAEHVQPRSLAVPPQQRRVQRPAALVDALTFAHPVPTALPRAMTSPSTPRNLGATVPLLGRAAACSLPETAAGAVDGLGHSCAPAPLHWRQRATRPRPLPPRRDARPVSLLPCARRAAPRRGAGTPCSLQWPQWAGEASCRGSCRRCPVAQRSSCRSPVWRAHALQARVTRYTARVSMRFWFQRDAAGFPPPPPPRCLGLPRHGPPAAWASRCQGGGASASAWPAMTGCRFTKRATSP